MADAPETAVEIATAVRDRRWTARQAVERSLRRIEDIDSRLQAWQEVRVFAALREADVVDARPDRAHLPLAGVPIAVKDNLPVQGEPMRYGSQAVDPTPRPDDHEVVRRVRAAGGVVIGITRVPELCVFATTDSTFGITRNPWDEYRTTGGSSGGSAAAVASGTVPVALGNDGLGSIRIPAACCGLVGVKPGYGVVPSEIGNGSWFGMAENGPLATTVADAALLLSVLAGRPELADVREPGKLRIAASIKAPAAGIAVERHWKAVLRESADLLRAEHAVTEADPPYPASLAMTEMARWTAGTALDAQLVRDRDKLAVRTKRHAGAGRMIMRAGLLRDPTGGGRTRWIARAERFFADHDVLLTPALAQSPVRAQAWAERGWLVNLVSNVRYAPFAAPWNLAGWPAMTVPAGLGPHGLPLAVQIVGRPGAEARLLGLAAQLERLRPWPRTAG